MTPPRLPYDDAATAAEMASDCAAVGVALHLPTQHLPGHLLGQGMGHDHDFRRAEVSEELALLAAGLEL